MPVTEFTTQSDRERMTHEVIHAAYEIIQGKGATNYAIGASASRIIESVVRDEKRVLPVSTLVDDYLGISDVCLSVPTVVGSRGAEKQLTVPMSETELAGLRASAGSIRSVARGLGF